MCISVEPPEVIDPCDLNCPDRGYRVDNLEMPEPILPCEESKVKFSRGDDSTGRSSPDKLN